LSRGASKLSERGCLVPRGPEGSARADLVVTDTDTVGLDGCNEGVRTYIDTQVCEVPRRAEREIFRKRGQNPRPSLDQNDPCTPRINASELGSERVPGDEGNGTRELDSGRAATNDYEGQIFIALPRVLALLCVLVGEEKAAADL
jgi:hypothetical protein